MTSLQAFLGSVIGKLILAAVFIGAILFGLNQCQQARQAGREATLSNEMGKAASGNAVDAVGVVGAVSGRNSASDNLTRENADAIRNASGANAPVDGGVRDAGLDGLCKRAAYRNEPKCLQRAAAAGMANAGGRGSAP